MKIKAYKYQGAGNDFVILDNRCGEYDGLTTEHIKALCDRRFGIGADGLMLLGKSEKYDFAMRYFNCDGSESTMCGNGGRCLVAFAYHRGIERFEFEALDGFHKAELIKAGRKECTVRLKMIDVADYQRLDEPLAESGEAYLLNTGAIHFVFFVKDVDNYPVFEKGRFWRNKRDVNVNFVEPASNRLKIRTYERGIEAETFACGTGATASSIASYIAGVKANEAQKVPGGVYNKYALKARGGALQVEFTALEKGGFADIYLTGPAVKVFECEVEV